MARANDFTRAANSSGRKAPAENLDASHGFNAMLAAARGSAVNFGSFVGATTIRQYVKGMEAGKATADQVRKMQELVGRSAAAIDLVKQNRREAHDTCGRVEAPGRLRGGVLQNREPGGDIGGVIVSDLGGGLQVGTEERSAQLGNVRIATARVAGSRWILIRYGWPLTPANAEGTVRSVRPQSDWVSTIVAS